MPSATASTVLVAERGEGAARVLRSAAAHGLRTVAVHAADDPAAHTRLADVVAALPGRGGAALTDHRALLDVAVAHGAGLVHPGDGLLAEDPAFATACFARGLVPVGPDSTVLERLGDKVAARDVARAAGLRTLPGTAAPTSPDQVRRFLGRHPDGVLLKPVRGVGGRGIEVVRHASDVDAAFARATDAAEASGSGTALYAERLVEWARHVEVQVVGAPTDGGVRVLALGDRDASVQRGHRPLVDVAPAPQLRDGVRRRMHAAAARFAAGLGLRGVATVELLLAGDDFVFAEANPRLVLGDAVTEAVTGVDLVITQLEIARGASFDELALPAGVVADRRSDRDLEETDGGSGVSGVPHRPAGIAVEVHVNAERVHPDGTAEPTSGTVTVVEPPHGAGIRVDTRCAPGDEVGGDDVRLASLVTAVRGDSLPGTAARCAQALDDLRLTGVRTTAPLLQSILRDHEFGSGTVGTDYLERRLPDLLAAAAAHEPPEEELTPTVAETVPPTTAEAADVPADVPPGARTHRADLDPAARLVSGDAADDSEVVLRSAREGTVVELAPPGTRVGAGEPVALVAQGDRQEVLTAPVALVVGRPLAARGAVLAPGDPVLGYAPSSPPPAPAPDAVVADAAATDADLREDLREVRRRHAEARDPGRGRHAAARHATGRRGVHDVLAVLLDEGSFVEYGPLASGGGPDAPETAPRVDPAGPDGLVCGLGTVNAGALGATSTGVAVLAHDDVQASGVPGPRAHAKAARVLALAEARGLPVLLLPEGGEGTESDPTGGLGPGTLTALGRLSGRVPVVGVVTGPCFGGRAALLGVCDVVVATPEAAIGLGGPDLVEATGLGRHRLHQVGPVDTHQRTGVVHLLAADGNEAVDVARDVLSRFQGPVAARDASEPWALRDLVPQDPEQPFDVREVVRVVADPGTVLELAPEHGPGLVTALVRVDGHSVGVVANSHDHLDGALDAEALDKLTSLWRTCDAHGLPVLALCDTPGLVVGPDAERDGGLRRLGRLVAEGARLSVPYGVVVLRRAFGLGATAMCAGSPRGASFLVAWPTGEVAGLGPEQAVRLEHRAELEAEPDPELRARLLDKLVTEARRRGTALAAAAAFEVDDVIDPAETGRWVRTLLPR